MFAENQRLAVAHFLDSEEGATMTEYVLLISLIVLGCFVAASALFASLIQPFQSATNALH
jgi:Flp pilus assembly pilin Flp